MARQLAVTLTSDKSGEVIDPGTGGRIRLLFNNEERVDMRADLTDAEIEKLVRDYKMKPVQPRMTKRRKRLSL